MQRLPFGEPLTFKRPLVSAGGGLAFPSIHSPNYDAGNAGWTINRDGTVEFNSLGGTFQVNNSGIFFYIPKAGSGNLRASITNADGTDTYGNIYKAGLFINQRQEWFTGNNSHTVTINPTGQTGPEILFTPATFSALMHILVEGANNRMLIEDTNSSGAYLEVNTGFVATGGIQGVNTAQGAQPPFNVTGSFVDYLSTSWTPLTFTCPQSETIQITTSLYGRNNNTASSTVAVGFKLQNTTLGSTLLSPALGSTSVVVTPEGDAAGATNNHFNSMTYTVGTDILSGMAGDSLKIIPGWRISSGSAATATIVNASMTAMPCAFVCPQSG